MDQNLSGVQMLVLLVAMLVGVNAVLYTQWICRYCGKRHHSGLVVAMLNDVFGISLCNHEGHP